LIYPPPEASKYNTIARSSVGNMDSPRSDHTSFLTRRTPSTPGGGGTPIGGKWESEAVGELQAVRAQQQWKRRPVLAWAIAFAALALLALRTSYSPPDYTSCVQIFGANASGLILQMFARWPSVMPPEEPQEMLWFAGTLRCRTTTCSSTLCVCGSVCACVVCVRAWYPLTRLCHVSRWRDGCGGEFVAGFWPPAAVRACDPSAYRPHSPTARSPGTATSSQVGVCVFSHCIAL
jgi:hypothetical protein